MQKRKSTRSFSFEELSTSLLNEVDIILQLGQKAGNKKSVRGRLVLSSSERETCFIASGFQEVIRKAPYLILIGNDDAVLSESYEGKHIESLGCQNASIAAQNLLLYLTEKSIGTCWVGGFENTYLQKKLNLDFRVWVMLCFGIENMEVGI